MAEATDIDAIRSPEEIDDIRHIAAGNIAYLLSAIRAGQPIDAEEERYLRATIERLMDEVHGFQSAPMTVDDAAALTTAVRGILHAAAGAKQQVAWSIERGGTEVEGSKAGKRVSKPNGSFRIVLIGQPTT